MTGMAELVFAVFVPSVASVAVTVGMPAVLSVTLKLRVPATKAALEGRAAFESDEEIAIVSVALVMRFQLASTALTVTVNALPAVWEAGVPVFPETVPGAAVSPGARIWSLLKAPGLTVTDGLV